MNKFFLIGLLLLAPNAFAQDHAKQISVGGGLGATFEAPWTAPSFKRAVGPKLPRLGAWANYTPGSPEIGYGLSYNYFSLSKHQLNTNAIILSFFSRMMPESNIHPNFAFGMGWSKTEGFFNTGKFESAIFQIRAGVDYELKPEIDLSFYVDHFSIFRNKPTDPNLHVLAPTFAISYFFGSPAVEKAAASTQVTAPTTPAPTVQTAPAVVDSSAPAVVTNESSSKKNSKPKKAVKRKQKKSLSDAVDHQN